MAFFLTSKITTVVSCLTKQIQTGTFIEQTQLKTLLLKLPVRLQTEFINLFLNDGMSRN